MQYLARRFDERTDPATYLPGARSVVCVALNYHVALEPVPDPRRVDAMWLGSLATRTTGALSLRVFPGVRHCSRVL